MQSLREFERIRSALLPAAGALRAMAETFSGVPGLSGPTKADLSQLGAYAREFQSAADSLFPALAPAVSEEEAAALLKKARHDARNHLNHVCSQLQILSFSDDYRAIEVPLDRMMGQADRCLKILAPPREDLEKAAEGETGNLPAVSPAVSAVTASLSSPKPGVVLIADDNADNRHLLARLLEHSGHQHHFAENGAVALEMIKRFRYDAVLLDIQMPVMDGFQVLEELKRSGHLRLTPVIVVTGLQEEQDAVRCIEIGAEDFLSRPIRHELLKARLKSSLEKKRLRERFFTQFFAPELALELARSENMIIEAREETVSMLFCDIRGFSSISEDLGPQKTVNWLGKVLSALSREVLDRGGVLVDYTGDELLGMWGAPNSQPQHARLACDAALAILDNLRQWNLSWKADIGSDTHVGIGVNTGLAMVGNIGTDCRFKYGPLGNPVNVASRVQGASKYLEVPLLITGETQKRLGPGYHTRRLCSVKVMNIRHPVDLYELVPNSVGQDPLWQSQAQTYEEALALFEQRNFKKAMGLLGPLVNETSDDTPCILLAERVLVNLRKSKSGNAEFSPIWELSGK